MWLAKYLLSLGLRKIGRGREALPGAAVEAGGVPPERAFRSQGLPRLEGWTTELARPQRSAAPFWFRARVSSRLAARAASNSACLSSSRANSSVRLFRAGDLAPRTAARPGCGVPCRRAVVQGQYRHPVRFL
jgi:hypothetical protein